MRPAFLDEPILRDFTAFGRARLAWAFAVVAIAAVLEGVGIMLLVPAIGLALGGASGSRFGEVVVSALAALGARTPHAQMAAMLAVFLAIVGLRFAVVLRRDNLLVRLEQDFVVDLRARAFRRLAAMSWRELTGMRQGQVGHALIRDVDRAAAGVGALIAGATAALIMAVQLSIAIALAPLIAMLAVLSGIGMFRLLRWLRDRAGRQGDLLTAEDFALFETATEFLKGLKPAKAHGLEGEYVTAFERAAQRTARAQQAFVRDRTLARLILQSGAAVIAVLAVLAGGLWLSTPVETLIVVVLILGRLYVPLSVIQQTAQNVRHAASGYRLARDLAFVPAQPLLPDMARPAELRMMLATAPEIRFVQATVPGDTEGSLVLDQIDCTVPAGRVTVLAGPSGAGKSTVCDLAVGLLRPAAGEVLSDGQQIEGEVAAWLAASVSYVGQEPFLLDESLRRNLTWGCGPVTDAEIWDTLETVGATELARCLRGGLDGSIRADGMRFSGGERQRLRLARALLRRPRLMVLDEATSGLDLTAEEMVLRSVLSARRGATVLLVSHRPGVRRLADRVIMLDGGRVATSGDAETG